MKLSIKKPLKLGIRKNAYMGSILSILLICFAFSKQRLPTGKELYEKNCVRCHGNEGTKHLFGTKSIQKSILDDNAILLIIQNGKRLMPSYKKKLTPQDISVLKDYIKTLRKFTP